MLINPMYMMARPQHQLISPAQDPKAQNGDNMSPPPSAMHAAGAAGMLTHPPPVAAAMMNPYLRTAPQALLNPLAATGLLGQHGIGLQLAHSQQHQVNTFLSISYSWVEYGVACFSYFYIYRSWVNSC